MRPVSFAILPGTELSPDPPSAVEAVDDLRVIYAKSSAFVGMALQRLGIRRSDLDDVRHDVFVIAHRRFADFDRRTPVSAWLYGICTRVAANYRRKARIRFEIAAGSLSHGDHRSGAAPEWTQPDQEFLRREMRAAVHAIVSRMNMEKRLVLIMFEVEGLSCREIAGRLGLPLGTVFSRLHAARQTVQREMDSDTDIVRGPARRISPRRSALP